MAKRKAESAKTFLDQSAQQYHSDILKGWEKLYLKKREYLFRYLKRYHVEGNALELGSADGIMTSRLCGEFESLTVVDGSSLFLDQLAQKVKAPNLKIVCSLFEEFSPEETYRNIFMTHILEHLEDPGLVLDRARDWLSPGGRIFVDVPNADSLHRQIGVKMGLLASRDSLNAQDLKLGHKRVYNPGTLRAQVSGAGFRIIHAGGIMIKPLSNRQIEESWSEGLIDAYFALGEDLPDLCSEINVVAERQ